MTTKTPYGVYLANAMTNLPAFNFPWFFEAEDWLLANTKITKVRNPARMDADQIPLEVMKTIPGYDTGDLSTYVANSSFTLAKAMKRDLLAILKSDGIVLGDRWPTSTGARYERVVAEALDRDIWLLHGTSDDDFELVEETDKLLLTKFLRHYSDHVADPLGVVPSRALLAEMRRRYRVDVKRARDEIESQLA